MKNHVPKMLYYQFKEEFLREARKAIDSYKLGDNYLSHISLAYKAVRRAFNWEHKADINQDSSLRVAMIITAAIHENTSRNKRGEIHSLDVELDKLVTQVSVFH
ncbi:hypothetical protein KY319_04100 [Candidatus Woesearchaeota archaeon]|nr:hypothetical protein [Candidatus Woesearchaeota archaeon]